MIAAIINDIRRNNFREPIFTWSIAENDNCLKHCYHLSRIARVEHAPAHLLNGKAEALAMCDFPGDTGQAIRYLFCEIVNGSDYDKLSVILNYKHVAYGFYTHNYKAYLTIRGWN